MLDGRLVGSELRSGGMVAVIAVESRKIYGLICGVNESDTQRMATCIPPEVS